MNDTIIKKELGLGKYVVLSRYQGKVYLHIRYYEKSSPTGKYFPTKRGVTLQRGTLKKQAI